MRKHSTLVVLLFVFSAFYSLALHVETAHALSGKGYFTGRTGSWTSGYEGDVLTGRPSNNAIPSSAWSGSTDAEQKNNFISFVEGRLGGSTHNKTGAAFIVNTMVRAGTSGNPSKDQTPSSSMISDWKNRIRSTNVTLSKIYGDPNDYGPGNGKKISFYDPGINDTFFTEYNSGKRDLLVFKYDGDVKYVLEIPCGNPVGDLSGIPGPYIWNLTPKTTIDRTEAAPGDIITWQHTITNSGPDKTTESAAWNVKASPSRIIATKPNGSGAYDNSGTFTSGKRVGDAISPRERKYLATAADVGKTLCQWITVDPNKWNDPSLQESAKKCVDIISIYELTPQLNGSSGVVGHGSQLGDVTATVKKAGVVDNPSTWRFGKVIIPPGAAIPGEGQITNNVTQPNTYYGGAWTQLASGSQKFTAALTQVATDPSPIISDALPVGTQVCWTLSLQPPSNQFAGWRHAAPVCVKVGKKPKLQILGSDLWARNKIDTSTSVIGGVGGPKVFGSWVEFGAFSSKDNNGLASGAGFRNGNGNINQSGWSGLTFANTLPTPPPIDSSSAFGNYSSDLPDAPEIAEHFSSRPSTNIAANSIDASTLSSDKVNTRTGDLIITRSNFPLGKSVVIIVSGTVTIADNITYTDGPFNSLTNIPQLAIIAKNIIVKDAVTQVDAWLVARGNGVIKGTIKTCENPAKSSTACNLKLTINGPVLTDILYLYRTAGSDKYPDTGNPAEVFNLRPDAYLWAYQQGLGSILPTTAATTELPPRF